MDKLNVMAFDIKSGKTRDVKRSLKFIQDFFATIKVKYVIVGAVALSLYAKPRNTEDIDILVLKSDKKKVLDYLDKLQLYYDSPNKYQLSVGATNGITDIDMLFGFVDPELGAIHNPRKHTIGGVSVNIISPEYLLYMYLSSDLLKHHLDAINLLKSETVKTWELIDILEDSDPMLIDELKDLVQESNYEVPSYGDHIEAKLKGFTTTKQ